MNETEAKRLSTLAFEDVSFAYEGAEPLFAGVSFEFPLDPWVSVQRKKEGAGASTLLQLLSGILEPSSGKVLYNNAAREALGRDDQAALQLQLGYSFDAGGLLVNRTLEQNLVLPLVYHRLVSADKAVQTAQVYLRRMGIESHRLDLPAAASPWVRKSCVLARALICRPRVVFLDEPVDSLPDSGIRRFLDLLEWHRQEHELLSVYSVGDDPRLLGERRPTQIYLEKGRLYKES